MGKAFKGIWCSRDGSLRTFRVSLAIFLGILMVSGVLHKVSRSRDTLLVQVAHIFTPEAVPPPPAAEAAEAAAAAAAAEAAPAVPAESAESLPPAEADKVRVEKTMPEKQAPERAETSVKPAEPAEQPGPTSAAQAGPETAESPEPADIRTAAARTQPPEPEKSVSLPRFSTAASPDTLELAATDYFELYSQWRNSGKALDKEGGLVALRIRNLKSVYPLFQMKAVAARNQVPFMDMGDGSRIAPDALSVYSTTCFVVNRPWQKWGQELASAGFSRGENLEVRYYTYGFIRDAIYARAMKAFAWSVAEKNLSPDTPPGDADVLGRVYSVRKAGGGAFGVFVPVRVDFSSGVSVQVDPLACFRGEPDIAALDRAGLL